MIKRIISWQVILALVLIVLSVIFYLISYAIFHDAHHIFITLFDDIAFAFLEVFLVTLVIHGLLSFREKKTFLRKLNMVIGTFFSEAGTELMQISSAFDPEASDIASKLTVTKDWSDKEFDLVYKDLRRYDCSLDYKRGDIEGLRKFLMSKRLFLLNLLENPNLLEHDSFSNLLWSTFHLTDELARRKDLKSLSETDSQHICNDIKRMYCSIIGEWVAYIKHLKDYYPYLFSLAMRTNPFDKNASVEVK